MNLVNRIGQGVLIAVAVFCALSIDIFGVLRSVSLDNGGYGGDFTIFWMANRVDPAILYDLKAFSAAQSVVLGPGDFGARPFVNPPSALPWLMPFSALPFGAAFVAWTVIGLAALWAAARPLLQLRHLPLILIAPPMALALAAGQVSLVVGALVVAGVLNLQTRPIVAGVLLALAATIKPPTVILVPLALAVGGHWRALASCMLAGLAVGLACVAVQGVTLWLDWLRALDGFTEVSRYYYLMQRGATPTSLAYHLGLNPLGEAVLVNACRLVGVAVVVIIFRRSRDASLRLAGLVGGGLLVSPYAMPHDAIVLLIPAVRWFLARDARGWPAGYLLVSQLMLPVGVIVASVTAAFLAVKPAR